MMIRNLDQEKFNDATVNNMDSERAVVSVNYGLKIRGAQEIKAFSSSLVKAKVVDYMDGRKVTKDFKKMTKIGEALPEILKEW